MRILLFLMLLVLLNNQMSYAEWATPEEAGLNAAIRIQCRKFLAMNAQDLDLSPEAYKERYPAEPEVCMITISDMNQRMMENMLGCQEKLAENGDNDSSSEAYRVKLASCVGVPPSKDIIRRALRVCAQKIHEDSQQQQKDYSAYIQENTGSIYDCFDTEVAK